MDFQPLPIRFEPTPDIFVLMIRSVVLDQDCAAATIAAAKLFKESSIRGCVEHRVLCIVETGTPQLNRPEDLHALSFSSDSNLGRTTHAPPRPMWSGILAVAGFIGEYQRTDLRTRFFLMLGYL